MIMTRPLVARLTQIKITACVAMIPRPFNWTTLTKIAPVIVVYFLTVFSPILFLNNSQSGIVVT